jgi:hypothetical protein
MSNSTDGKSSIYSRPKNEMTAEEILAELTAFNDAQAALINAAPHAKYNGFPAHQARLKKQTQLGG